MQNLIIGRGALLLILRKDVWNSKLCVKVEAMLFSGNEVNQYTVFFGMCIRIEGTGTEESKESFKSFQFLDCGNENSLKPTY